MQKGLTFFCAALALASCSPGDAPVAGSAQPAAAYSAEPLPAVTDQELDALIDVVMQGVDVPRP